jgi:hypothetical protein
VWAPTAQHADQLRGELTDSGFLVLDADPWELDQQSLIPEGEHLEFDQIGSTMRTALGSGSCPPTASAIKTDDDQLVATSGSAFFGSMSISAGDAMSDSRRN